MCHSVLENCCLVVPVMVFPGNSACFSGLVTVLNDENLRAAFIIPFIFSQIIDLILPQPATVSKLSYSFPYTWNEPKDMVPARNAQYHCRQPNERKQLFAQKVFCNSTGITGANVLVFAVLYYVFFASRGMVKSRSPAIGTSPNVERIQVKELGLKCFRMLLKNAQKSVRKDLGMQLLLPFARAMVRRTGPNRIHVKHLHNPEGK